ncbi:membrane protein [Marinosulfonomonas sp. PRT-SC04]|nr:membrane protein [Marinosulfonomonas sp. PRT-SC04]
MTHLYKAIFVVAALGLGACTNPDNLAGNGTGLGAGSGIGAGAGTYADPASDPSSPAYFSQTIGDRVLFSVDTSTLTPAGRATLVAQAGWLTSNPEYAAIIEGHADEQGTREYNLALGARRANAVSEFLISQGIAGSRLRTLTYGKERPIEVCSAESCYAKNRRAVSVISAGAGV